MKIILKIDLPEILPNTRLSITSAYFQRIFMSKLYVHTFSSERLETKLEHLIEIRIEIE